MAIQNTKHRWGVLSQLFHWTIVALLIVQVTLAFMFDDLPNGMRKLTLLARHKSVGITILMLVILRLIWRQLNQNPDLMGLYNTDPQVRELVTKAVGTKLPGVLSALL